MRSMLVDLGLARRMFEVRGDLQGGSDRPSLPNISADEALRVRDAYGRLTLCDVDGVACKAGALPD